MRHRGRLRGSIRRTWELPWVAQLGGDPVVGEILILGADGVSFWRGPRSIFAGPPGRNTVCALALGNTLFGISSLPGWWLLEMFLFKDVLMKYEASLLSFWWTVWSCRYRKTSQVDRIHLSIGNTSFHMPNKYLFSISTFPWLYYTYYSNPVNLELQLKDPQSTNPHPSWLVLTFTNLLVSWSCTSTVGLSEIPLVCKDYGNSLKLSSRLSVRARSSYTCIPTLSSSDQTQEKKNYIQPDT